MRHSRIDRGFSAIELAVVLCLVAGIGAFMVGRVQALQASAERAKMDHVIAALRSAAALEFASYVIRGKKEQTTNLEGTNPMERLAEKPANYLGEFEAPEPSKMRPGYWYFDKSRELLVYRVRHDGWFETGLPGPPRARFKLELLYADAKWSRPSESAKVELQGLIVAPAEPYRWRQPGKKEKELGGL
jgi:general secretion pathway protein G